MTNDPAAVDALVTALHPGVQTSAVAQTRDVVLVTGAWLAGSTAVIQALSERLPDRTFVDAAELADDEAPAAVVYVGSAVSSLTESDCALLDAAAANTDLVVGAVSKIDAHPGWRGVLSANRAAVTGHDARYADMVWVGVAAAPEVGGAQVDELVDALEAGMADGQLPRRNRLRAWHTGLSQALRRHEESAAGVGRETRMAALRQERAEILAQRRLARSERAAALHDRIERTTGQLTDFARNRCASVRSELAEDAATMRTRRRLPEFEKYVERRVGEVIGEVHAGVGLQLGDVAAESGLTPPSGGARPSPRPSPPLPTTGRPSRLTMLGVAGVGVVVGLVVAVALSRFAGHLALAYIAAGAVGGVALGLLGAWWVVRLRRASRDRVKLARWVDDVIADLGTVVEQHVA
ncbi:MAG: hypothetical protein JO280_16905, partial [Mycobacteriaceae bacterium]|nr:hypothetical protein [Mycobacteriaceae bacterium]